MADSSTKRLRGHLADRDSELICLHRKGRKGRKKKPAQDNRKARRLQRRWIVG
ncbi:hypothetical protein [Thalassoglobus neptunius]|uniref:hypothetical protein n=1 Tax=Thalassoglobus neptunius TaxID=1938619 RepID=UPI0018D27053|nr:hypothetical protein [Thalassoglobus neptunius]